MSKTKQTKLPAYFEAFGSVGVVVSFVAKTKLGGKPYHGTVTMLLAECPAEMRRVVNSNWEAHINNKFNSGYELKQGKYSPSPPLPPVSYKNI